MPVFRVTSHGLPYLQAAKDFKDFGQELPFRSLYLYGFVSQEPHSDVQLCSVVSWKVKARISSTRYDHFRLSVLQVEQIEIAVMTQAVDGFWKMDD